MTTNYQGAENVLERAYREATDDPYTAAQILATLAVADEIRDLRLSLSSVNPKQVTQDSTLGVLTDINNALWRRS